MKKNNGSIAFVFIAIVILGIVGMVGFLVYDNVQYNVVAQEISNINMNKTVDMEIKSKGKYQNLEKAIKEYANEYYSNVNKLKELYTKDELKMSLGIDNLKNDGPNFDNTKATISNFITEQKTIKEKLQEMVSEDYLNKKADENSLYEKNRELFISTLDLKEDASKIVEVIDSYEKYANSIDDVLNFLKENQNGWSIKENKIMFNNVDLLNSYNSLIETQKTVQNELKSKLSNNKM